MPVKVVPPVLITQQSLSSKQNIGPITVMSGFMTKKGRALNRWKQRWFQLLDNGYLFYFKSDDRLRILGQIDIARTCYDVRLGSEKCRVTFPRAAPSCCCIYFAVLKRNYYVYTPTAGEAEKWTEAISNMSQVINRKVFAGVERRKAPDPPGPTRPPSCPPNYQIKMTRVRTAGNGQGKSDSYEDFTRIEYIRKRTNLTSQREMAFSVPDSLDKIADDCISLGENESLDSRLWLDGSPPAQCGLVHPSNKPSTVDFSWDSPANGGSSPTARKRSYSSPPRERLYSLPTRVTMDYEPLNDQQTQSQGDNEGLDHYLPNDESQDDSYYSPHEGSQDDSEGLHHYSPDNQHQQDDSEGLDHCLPDDQHAQDDSEGLDHYLPALRSPSEVKHTLSLAHSKGLSRSLDDLQSSSTDLHTEHPVRPIPKPRKPRTHTATAEVTFALSPELSLPATTLQLPSFLPEMRPRNNSEPPPIRPRKGSGAKGSGKTLSPQRSNKSRSSKSRRRSKRLSPPSTPPPPPPPQDDNGTPSMFPKPSGPPKFVPPPPPE